MGAGGGVVASPGLGVETMSAQGRLAEITAESGYALGSKATTVTIETTVPQLCVPACQDPWEGQQPPSYSRKVRWPSWSQAAGGELGLEPRRLQPAEGHTGHFRLWAQRE